MPRVADEYSLPASYQATDDGLATPAQHNEPLEDIAADLNAPRPVSKGGTGGTSSKTARGTLRVAFGVQTYDDLDTLTYDEADVGGLVHVAESGAILRVLASGAGDGDFAGSGDMFLNVEKTSGRYLISHFNPDGTNAKVALKRAVELLQSGDRLVIDTPLTVAYSEWTDVPKIPDGATIDFRAPITHQTFGVPCMWHETTASGTNITINNAHIIYDDTAPTTRPDIQNDFYDNTFKNSGYSNRAQTAMLFFRGGTVSLNGLTRIEAADFSAADKLVPRCVVMLKGPDGENGRCFLERYYFDGTLFGIVGTGFDFFEIGGGFSDRWSQLDTSVYTWEAPAHVWYFTPDTSGDYVLKIGPCFDQGTEVGTPYVTGATSYKCTTRSAACQIGPLYSRRSQGIADLEVSKGHLLGGAWDGSASSQADMGGGKALRIADFNDGGSEDADLGRWDLIMPSDYNDYVQLDATRCRAHFSVTLTGNTQDTPILQGVMNRCLIGMNIEADQAQATAFPVAARIDSGGSNNHIDIMTNAPFWSALRVISQVKTTSTGNSAIIRHAQTGSTRRLGQYCERAEMFVTELLAAVSGATVTTGTLVPKGGHVMGLSARVVTSLGTTSGLTGFTVGTASDADLYGTANAITANGGTEDNDWTADGGGWQAANLAVQLTAVGGDFDGTGDVQVSAHYTMSSRNNDLI